MRTPSGPKFRNASRGRLAQAATLTGLEGISPGRNIQLIPYGLLNSFRDLDARNPADPHFENRAIGGTFGLDSKIVLNDSLVLDLTANPDFSQVESDEPQVTVNQRFAVYFPEKRPFFIENADYFRTPIDLFFTRQIVNPSYGARLTGKLGPYSLGVADRGRPRPRSVGRRLRTLWPARGNTSRIARVSRDIFKQSSIGAIYTDEEYPGGRGLQPHRWTRQPDQIHAQLDGYSAVGRQLHAIPGRHLSRRTRFLCRYHLLRRAYELTKALTRMSAPAFSACRDS